jgi:hypothetical protein
MKEPVAFVVEHDMTANLAGDPWPPPAIVRQLPGGISVEAAHTAITLTLSELRSRLRNRLRMAGDALLSHHNDMT